MNRRVLLLSALFLSISSFALGTEQGEDPTFFPEILEQWFQEMILSEKLSEADRSQVQLAKDHYTKAHPDVNWETWQCKFYLTSPGKLSYQGYQFREHVLADLREKKVAFVNYVEMDERVLSDDPEFVGNTVEKCITLQDSEECILRKLDIQLWNERMAGKSRVTFRAYHGLDPKYVKIGSEYLKRLAKESDGSIRIHRLGEENRSRKLNVTGFRNLNSYFKTNGEAPRPKDPLPQYFYNYSYQEVSIACKTASQVQQEISKQQQRIIVQTKDSESQFIKQQIAIEQRLAAQVDQIIAAIDREANAAKDSDQTTLQWISNLEESINDLELDQQTRLKILSEERALREKAVRIEFGNRKRELKLSWENFKQKIREIFKKRSETVTPKQEKFQNPKILEESASTKQEKGSLATKEKPDISGVSTPSTHGELSAGSIQEPSTQANLNEFSGIAEPVVSDEFGPPQEPKAKKRKSKKAKERKQKTGSSSAAASSGSKEQSTSVTEDSGEESTVRRKSTKNKRVNPNDTDLSEEKFGSSSANGKKGNKKRSGSDDSLSRPSKDDFKKDKMNKRAQQQARKNEIKRENEKRKAEQKLEQQEKRKIREEKQKQLKEEKQRIKEEKQKLEKEEKHGLGAGGRSGDGWISGNGRSGDGWITEKTKSKVGWRSRKRKTKNRPVPSEPSESVEEIQNEPIETPREVQRQTVLAPVQPGSSASKPAEVIPEVNSTGSINDTDTGIVGSEVQYEETYEFDVQTGKKSKKVKRIKMKRPRKAGKKQKGALVRSAEDSETAVDGQMVRGKRKKRLKKNRVQQELDSEETGAVQEKTPFVQENETVPNATQVSEDPRPNVPVVNSATPISQPVKVDRKKAATPPPVIIARVEVPPTETKIVVVEKPKETEKPDLEVKQDLPKADLPKLDVNTKIESANKPELVKETKSASKKIDPEKLKKIQQYDRNLKKSIYVVSVPTKEQRKNYEPPKERREKRIWVPKEKRATFPGGIIPNPKWGR